MTWKLPWDGGCRCNQLRFRVTAPPMLAAACHCRGCQKMSASAFSLSLAVPVDAFAITAGETVVGGLHDPKALHHMCKHCLAWVFTTPEGFPIVNFRATMLDDHAWFRPFVDLNASEQLAFASTGAPHRIAGMPTIAEIGTLCAAFAQEGARP